MKQTNKQKEKKTNKQTNKVLRSEIELVWFLPATSLTSVERVPWRWRTCTCANQIKIKSNETQFPSLPPPYVKWISLIKLSWALLMFIGPLVDFYQLYYSAI